MRRGFSGLKRIVRVFRNISFHTILVVVGVGVFLLGGLVLWAANLRIPDLDTFDQRIVEQSTKIYDRTGEVLLYDLHENTQRTVVAYEDISRHVKNATVAIEDAEFYEHRGVKPTAVIRAVLANLMSGDLLGGQGGSTITQQVVKNSLLTTEKTISRKLKEWVLAVKIEGALSKEEILALYLNETPYGGALYGVEEASRAFFGKPAGDLTIAESAYLAALPQAPTYYSPYGNNRDALEGRKNLVLSKMLEYGFITEDEYESAGAEEVVFKPRPETGILAPHFVFYVIEQLEREYGEQALQEEGFKVITTLDQSLQEKAQDIVQKHALQNEETFNAENAGMVAIDPATGEILTMVGSRDYFDPEIDGNVNVALARRQPGSSFKPFVYSTAFKRGYTPETVVFDARTEFSTTCSVDGRPLESGAVCYRPQNYDNIFRGPISFRNALAQSVNVPAVKVLYLAGLDESLKTARDLGITTLTDKSRYGLTLVLGGGEVTLLEMTSAYGVFAKDGVRANPVSILKIESNDGEMLFEYEPRTTRALDENIARQISDILSDNVARAPAFGESSYLSFETRDVAVKTGTTNDYRDAWILGYTPRIAVGAWAGNNDNSSMEKRVAGFIVAPMWREFMDTILAEENHGSFTPPSTPDPREQARLTPALRGIWEGSETYIIDTVSGGLATEYTPEETREEHAIRNVHSILHWVDRVDPLGGIPENPDDDPQYPRWEYGVVNWLSAHGIAQSGGEAPPDEFDDVHTEDSVLDIELQGVKEAPYAPTESIELEIDSRRGRSPTDADVYVNGSYVGAARGRPLQFTIDLGKIETLYDSNTIRVTARDAVFNKGEVEVEFSVF